MKMASSKWLVVAKVIVKLMDHLYLLVQFVLVGILISYIFCTTFKGAMMLSQPHFYQGSNLYVNQSVGLNPDKERHEMALYVESVIQVHQL